ncbi:A24 family peptidase [Nocardioides sp. 1609]|uniref:prepilin peptidase n=1 Tax=Nocardioides sp. 1609 TaxID=2508327 RepID=UPI001FD6BE1C|nr:A24 family peptidase [Nocardioides sp. 1609]
MTDAAAVPAGLVVALAGVLGLLVGSFLNVVVHRVPAGLSVVSPPSACPGCAHVVRHRDNVPVVSWLLLRGRCRDCAVRIPARYPLVEAGTGAAFAVTAWRFDDPVVLVAALVVVGAGIGLALIDLEHQRLPFAITRVATILVVLVVVAGAAAGSTIDWTAVAVSVACWTGLYALLHYGSGGRAMGLGDVALAPVLGLVLGLVGWPAAIVGLFGGFVLGTVVLVPLRATGRIGRRAAVPHGPFMLAGAALGLFLGVPLSQAYLATVGIT